MVSYRLFGFACLGLVSIVELALADTGPAQDVAPAQLTSAAPSSVDLNGHRFYRHVLRNGLKAVAVQDETDRVSIFMVVAAGRRQETAETTGLAHLTEHMMYTGTAKTGPGAHDQRIRELGGSSNAYTRDDYTLFYNHDVPVENLSEVLSMEADRLRHLTFQAEAVEQERERLRQEEADTWDSSQRLTELLEDAVFQQHPYKAGLLDENGHTRAGSLDLATVQEFYHRYYQPNYVTLVVAGGVAPDQALDAIERAFGQLPAGPPPEEMASEPEVTHARREVLRSSLSRDRLEWVWIIPSLSHADRPALQVLAEVLSQKETATTSPPYVSVGNRLDRDLFRLALTGPDAEKNLEKLYHSMVSNPFDPELVEQAKRRVVQSLLRRELRARPYFSLAGSVGVFEALDHADYLLGYESAVETLQTEDLRRVTRRHLDPHRRVSVLFQGTNAPWTPLPSDSTELRRAAIEALEAGNLERAVAAFTELLNRNPNKMHRVIYLASRGEARTKQRDYVNAIRDFENALEIIDYPDLHDLLETARALQAGVSSAALAKNPTERPQTETHPHLPANHPSVDEARRAQEAGLLSRVQQNQKELEEWRGLSFQHDVEPEFVDASEGKLGGYYDPEKKQLVLVRGREAEFSKGVLLHELHHALQDQHWDLSRLQAQARTSDDARALNGLIEGEAMLAVATLMGYDFSVHMKLPEEGTIERARFEKIFAYGEGVRFVKSLLERGGWDAVNKAWENPPLSTAELFHPDRYPASAPTQLDLPITEGEVVREDRLGELELRWLLVHDQDSRSRIEELMSAFEVDRWQLVRLADGTERQYWDLRFTTPQAASEFAKRAGPAVRKDGWHVKVVNTDVRMWRPTG